MQRDGKLKKRENEHGEASSWAVDEWNLLAKVKKIICAKQEEEEEKVFIAHSVNNTLANHRSQLPSIL